MAKEKKVKEKKAKETPERIIAPDIRPGSIVKVTHKIVEGDKERLVTFQGTVIKMRGVGESKTITVRKISRGIGVERIFPLHSPIITKIEVKKQTKVRRAKLYYLREKKGQEAKLKEG
ncbi:MAG: 50S ribosomal protein L19 [candidate division WOR-3 bacterium]|nr:50S ribosomal protein L19 [candidate division WOR-3 bacterium]